MKPPENGGPNAGPPVRPLVIAHRGASGIAPENTLAAFRMAISLGADGIEMDAQLSADGKAVVIHDLRVNRTTDGSGPVAGMTLEQLSKLDAGAWFDRRLALGPAKRLAARAASDSRNPRARFAGERVPSLESALELLSGSGLSRVYVELKGRAGSDKSALLRDVISIVRRYRMEQSVTLLSFDHAAVKRAKELAPEIRVAATFPVARRALARVRSIIESVERAGADEAALHFGLVTRRSVEELHERGISVSAWTANNRIIMRRLVACGVDSIMTNYPHRLAELLESPASGGPRSLVARIGARRRD